MGNRQRNNRAAVFFTGLGLVCLGAYLFVSLQTYHPRDIPAWAPLISTTNAPSAVVNNLGGTLGALLAGYALFAFGAASYILAIVLLGYGLALWLITDYRLRDKAGWGLLMVVIGACLFAIQPWVLRDWDEWIKIESPGGWFGHWIGQAFSGVFGPFSAVLLGLLYLLSLTFAISTHPVRDVRASWKAVAAWREARRAARLARLDEDRRLAEERKLLEKKAEKLERKLRRKAPEAVEATPPAAAASLPEPEIIDATAPRPGTATKTPATQTKTGEELIKPGLADLHLENYELPPVDLLDPHDETARVPLDRDELKGIQTVIIDTLQQFGIKATPGTITKGPTITRFEVYPDIGVRVDKIVALERDIARATRAEKINILAPIPGKDTVGIEIANSKKVKVTLRELFEKEAWRESTARLPLALGMDVYGNTIIGDLAKMPHCLVAGTTGSGKSVCINAIIASLLFRYSPEQLRFIMIDPKVVEMQVYNALPHLITPVVTDPKKVLLALRWVVDEMELRYKIFAKCGLKNIAAFNDRPLPKSQSELDADAKDEPETETVPETGVAPEAEEEPEAPPIRVRRDEEMIIPDRLPYIVVIIDELADLMQTAPADVESAIARITQMARAAGIHMIVATQTPRADVVTGIIKANIPSRIAFQVASKIDSRVILDENGADKLLGMGDMLYLPPGTSKLNRAQGVLVTEEEIHRIVDFVSKQAQPAFDSSIHEKLQSSDSCDEDVSDEDEELVAKCLEIIRQENRASTSMLQRRLKLGYTRAARVVDILEKRGVVGPKDGARDREILVDLNSMDSTY